MTVFCDFQKASKTINHSTSWKKSGFVRGMIYLTAKKLDRNGNRVAIHRVFGHLDLIKNEKADLAARIRAERESRQEKH